MRFLWIFAVGAICCCGLFSGCSGNRKNVDSCLFTATKAMDNGQWEKALQSAEEALKLEPENVNALLTRAVSAERLGRRDLAFDSARMAAKIAPESFMAQYTLGRLYAGDPSRLSEAATPLVKALRLNAGDRNTLILLVNVSSALNSERTLYYLKELAFLDRNLAESAEFQNQLGIAYARQNERNLAAQAFFSAYRKAAKNPQIVLNTAVFVDGYYGQPQKSLAFYRAFLTLTANNPENADSRTAVNARIREISGR